jgi:hypothetical protein
VIEPSSGQICPAGSFCPNKTIAIGCEAGSVCLLGTNASFACFNDAISGSAAERCLISAAPRAHRTAEPRFFHGIISAACIVAGILLAFEAFATWYDWPRPFPPQGARPLSHRPLLACYRRRRIRRSQLHTLGALWVEARALPRGLTKLLAGHSAIHKTEKRARELGAAIASFAKDTIQETLPPLPSFGKDTVPPPGGANDMSVSTEISVASHDDTDTPSVVPVPLFEPPRPFSHRQLANPQPSPPADPPPDPQPGEPSAPSGAPSGTTAIRASHLNRKTLSADRVELSLAMQQSQAFPPAPPRRSSEE